MASHSVRVIQWQATHVLGLCSYLKPFLAVVTDHAPISRGVLCRVDVAKLGTGRFGKAYRRWNGDLRA